MSLLSTSETKQKIAEQVSSVQDNLQIVSAYCKLSAVQFIDTNIRKNVKSKKLLVRFLLSDIIQGATDFDLYEYCKQNGWQLYIRFDLHAKTYIFDRKRCILGSANLTSRGLGLSLYGNYELSSFSEIDDADLKKIDLLFEHAIQMDDTLFEKMKEEYRMAKENRQSTSIPKWTSIIEKQFAPPIETLFTYDFPAASAPDFTKIEAFEFLELSAIPTLDELRQAFRWSKCFLWLYNYINSCPGHFAYFGSITEALHNALINDPRPYRKEVKDILANLLKWVEILQIDDLSVDVPNHSQRVKINCVSEQNARRNHYE